MGTVDRGSFAELLRGLRRAAELTQEALAERSGVSVRSISDLEREINERPRRDTAVMLADGLGLTGDERAAFLEAARRRPRFARGLPSPIGPSPLPEPAGALIGRADELQTIEGLLATEGVRLLTLTGPGGVGKTRLAIELARQGSVRSWFADGVVFVRLDGLNDPALVLPALADALRLLETGDELALVARIAARVAGRQMLIILDNMEHLLPAAGDVVELLGRAPQVKMLVTSREALRVGNEHVFAVPPLPRPDPVDWQSSGAVPTASDAPAIALFVQRALTAPQLDIDPSTPTGRANLAIIAETCHRLDGLPLAIELAAAQAQVLSPSVVLALMKHAGLPLLAGGSRDQPSRLQTMDAAIAWSYNLLQPEEQALFRALSVFASGFSLPAAAAVAWSSAQAPASSFDPREPLAGLDPAFLAAIASLARKHLLIHDMAVRDHAAPRFRMLEPIRLYALDRLRAAGEERAGRRRHAAFFTELAALLNPLTLGPEPEIWLRQQVIDLDNFRAALDWTLENGEHHLFVRLTCEIAQLWELRGLLSEARQRMTQALAVEAASAPAERWFLRFWAVTFALDGGDADAAAAYAGELLQIASDHDEPVGVGVGLALSSRAIGAKPDRHAEAAEFARRAVAVLEPLGNDIWTALAWVRLGIECHRLGPLDEACDALLRALDLRQRSGCVGCTAYVQAALAAVLLDLDEPQAAVDAYLRALDLAVTEENLTLLLAVLLGLADVAWRAGEETAAMRVALLLAGAAEALRLRHGMGREATREAITRWQAPMRRMAGDAVVGALIQEGMVLPLEEVVDLAGGLRVERRRERAGVGEPRMSLMTALGSIE